MLRVDRRAGFTIEGTWFWKRHRFRTGKLVGSAGLRSRELAELEALQREQPVALIKADRRQWWWFRDCFYWEDDLSAGDVMALVTERERRKRRRLDRAHAVMQQELDGLPRREQIPREVKLAVWQRDGGRCVDCGGDFDLQYDHVIPLSMGGATSAKNLQLLCGDCNRAKGAAL